MEKIRHAEKVYDDPVMTKDDRWALRDEIQELTEEAAALTDRAKKTARHAEVLSERIKHLETQIAKTS
jgi:predicted nuclease with TOPRIM domain